MASQIENRIERLENNIGTGAARVVLAFDDDEPPPAIGATLIRVRFVEPEGRGARHDDTD